MQQSYYYSIKTNSRCGRGGLRREMCEGICLRVCPGPGFPVYHRVINNFINLLCVVASDHFISSPQLRYCSGYIINLIYIQPPVMKESSHRIPRPFLRPPRPSCAVRCGPSVTSAGLWKRSGTANMRSGRWKIHTAAFERSNPGPCVMVKKNRVY